jgi:hypothetical protein
MFASVTAATLSLIVEKVFASLVGGVSSDLYQKLKGDPIKKAYKKALGIAIQRYAVGEQLVLAQPLLARNGILIEKDIATEIAQIIRFRQKPDLKLIGNRWEAALPNLSGAWNFTEQAGRLLDLIEAELRNTETFRPVFEAQDINAVRIVSEDLDLSLSQIEAQLDGLNNLLDSRLGQLLNAFVGSTTSIHSQILDNSLYIEEKTRDFVGRQWIFDAVNTFLKSNPRGYFLILGDPGIGKSALAAQLVKSQGYIHHFNIRAEGINNAASFLKNVCAQLIAVYQLEYETLPLEATDNAGFLKKLLNQVSKKIEHDQHCVIIVDGLDEVDSANTPVGENLLYLPEIIPDGVFIIVTMRKDEGIKPRIDCEQGELYIDHDSADNLADIADFIKSMVPRSGIQTYMNSQKLLHQEFIDLLVAKSEGNFIYLHYILPEIEFGTYKDVRLDAIPNGLKNYYQDHWHRMRGQNEEEWFNYKLPVILALTVALEPISIELIVLFSKINDRRRVRAVIEEWSQFLHRENIEIQGQIELRYRLYHASFFDFIASKQEIKDERVDLKAVETEISKLLWNSFYGN